MIRTMLFFISLIPLPISPSQGMSQINEIEGVFLWCVQDGYSICGKTALAMEEIVVFDEILSVILEKYPLHEDKHIEEILLSRLLSMLEFGKTTTRKHPL